MDVYFLNYYDMKNVLIVTCLIIITSCSNELKKENETLRSEISRLESENKSLKSELISFKMDPELLFANAEKFYSEKNVDSLKSIIVSLERYHPMSEMKDKISIMISDINAELEKQKKDEEQKRLKAVNKLKKSVDDVSGTTWYKNPYFTHYTNRNLTSLYIGKSGSTVWLRLLMSYTGDDWIFFENAYLSYEGNTKEIYFDKYDDKETEVGNGGVWEWIDVVVNDSDLNFLKQMAESNDCKMRLSGKYTKTRNLSLNERKAITDVLLAYDVLKNEK